MNIRVDVYLHLDSDLRQAMNSLVTKVDTIMLTQTQLAATLTTLGGEIKKIGVETTTLLEKVTALTEAVANAGNTSPEVDAALADVQAQAQVVDDLVPDVPTV
jgi:hypothetical protein